MAATYTAGDGSDKNRVRLLIADTDVTAGVFLLQDEEILDLLVLESNIYLAAAAALEIVAASEVLVSKKIRMLSGDLTTDGPAVAKSLREIAQGYRERGGAETGGFEIIELGTTPHARATMRHNAALSGGS